MDSGNSDEIKMELLRRSARHREDLENEVRLLSARTEKVLTNALIIGGTLAASYFIVRQLTGGKKTAKSGKKSFNILPAKASSEVEEVEDDSPGIMSQIGTALASQATVFLLGLAKEKLAEYLDSTSHTQATNNDERP